MRRQALGGYPAPWPARPGLVALLLLGLVATLFLVSGVGCAGRERGSSSGQQTATPGQERGTGAILDEEAQLVNQIAYTGSDGGLFVINPDGTGSRRLAGEGPTGSAGYIQAQTVTGSAIYTWPTWSPQGNLLGVSRALLLNTGPRVAVHVVDAASAQSVLVYQNEPDASPLIASDAPHYLYWSPDGQTLSFIASTPGGLTLFAASPDGQGGVQPIATQGPIYYSWSADSSSIVMHRGDELLLGAGASLNQPRLLGQVGSSFRAPASSPTDSQAVYVAPANGGLALLRVDTTVDAPAEPIAEVGSSAAFLWSPEGQQLAVVDSFDASSPLYQRLRIVRADGTGERTLVQEPLMAFFWSPNGEQLLYVTVAPGERALQWKVVQASDGTTRTITDFLPSPELFTMLSFFDQYAYSHSLWSPDSASFVFAGTLRGEPGRGNGTAPTADKVYVVDVASATAREIASGRIAFWSWN